MEPIWKNYNTSHKCLEAVKELEAKHHLWCFSLEVTSGMNNELVITAETSFTL